MNTANPEDILLPYQREYANDESRFKFGLFARQTGKDFSSGFEGVRDIFRAEAEGNKRDWLIGAPSERQSMESLGKWKEWTEVFKLAIEDYEEERESKHPEALLKSATIVFPGGSRAIAVPGKPDTVRGFSANVLLTEFAFFEQPDLTWRAIVPSITNPLRGGLKKIRLITTPNGQGNKAHDLWKKAVPYAPGLQLQKGQWSGHKVSIYDAVRLGLPVDIEELREALNDPEGWAQEFEVEFLDAANVLLPYELIALCENPLATTTVGPDFWRVAPPGSGPCVAGLDFARSKDLSVLWTDEVIAGGAFLMTKEVLTMAQMSTPKQFELIAARMGRIKRLCVDYTGPGVGLGDLLVEKFGEYNPEEHKHGKVELCTFTAGLKAEMFPHLRMSFENRKRGIPIDRVIREDLHSMYRVALKGGGVTYRAPHTPDGHADRCTSLALSNRAAMQLAGGVPGTVTSNFRNRTPSEFGRRSDRRNRGRAAGV